MPTIQYINGEPFLIPDEVTNLPAGTQPALPVTQDYYPAGYDNQAQSALPAQPDMWATVARAGKRLLGVGGEERYQTWPERTIRSALTLPAEVMQGTVQSGPGLRREDVTDIPGTAQPLDPLMERAQDVAGLAGGTMFAGVKPGVASLGAGPVRRMATEMSEKVPMFYSNVENAVKASKQNVASKEQWLSYLKNQPGVKPEELEWIVANLPEGKITKQQLEQHIAENKVQFNEVWKGEYKPEKLNEEKYYNDLDKNARHMYNEPYDSLTSTQQNHVRQETFYNQGINPTKYQSYQLPGGENYRELLLTLPHNADRRTPLQTAQELFKNPELKTIYDLNHNQMRLLQNEIDKQVEQGKQLFRSSHWDESNVLAHIRMNDREIPDVGKSLHIEEIQSDWHQAGRKQGYKLPEKEKLDLQKELENTTNKRIELQKKLKEQAINEPPIPATKEQKDLLISLQEKEGELTDRYNKYIHDAVPNAPFKKTWDELALKRTINEAVRNGYDAISWTPGEAQAARYDLSKHVNELHYQNKTNTLTALDHNGRTVIDEIVPKEKVSDYIGKEAAEKLFKTEPDETGQHLLEGTDLKIGGEGMKAFYDKMMVDKVNALAKKFGGKVETKDLNKSRNIIKDKRGYHVEDDNGLGHIFKTEEEAKKFGSQPVHVLKLTPELKKAVSEKGFPLFTGGIPHVPPAEEPTFNERWRERVPEEIMNEDEIKNLLEKSNEELPLNYKPPERFMDKRAVRLTKVDYNPEF